MIATNSTVFLPGHKCNVKQHVQNINIVLSQLLSKFNLAGSSLAQEMKRYVAPLPNHSDSEIVREFVHLVAVFGDMSNKSHDIQASPLH